MAPDSSAASKTRIEEKDILTVEPQSDLGEIQSNVVLSFEIQEGTTAIKATVIDNFLNQTTLRSIVVHRSGDNHVNIEDC
ncbi:MAG: hypothetical protein AAF353_17795 [Pseudomonadota bacterium]